MQILSNHMSKSRRFHISILGDSQEDCSYFEYRLSQLPSINPITITLSVRVNKDYKYEGSVTCKSSNYKKFKVELEELISEYEKEN